MLKVLQVAIIPVLLCANLLGDEYGVEKWPKFLGKGIEWGMSSKDATAKMAGKGHKFHSKMKAPPPLNKIFANILSYRGKFLNMNVETYFFFSADDELIKQSIFWGWQTKAGLASDELIRRRLRALQEDPSIFILGEREREILKTGVKIRGLIVKQYGKPSMEEFIDGEGPNADTLCYGGGGTVLTMKEALAAKTGNIHYTLRYKNKKTKRFSEEHEYIKFCFNHLNGSLESWGPNYYDGWVK